MGGRASTAVAVVGPAIVAAALLLGRVDWHAHQAVLAALLAAALVARADLAAAACLPLMAWPIEWEHGELVFMHQYLVAATVDVPIGAPAWAVAAGACVGAEALLAAAARLGRPLFRRSPRAIAIPWIGALAAGAAAACATHAAMWALANAIFHGSG